MLDKAADLVCQKAADKDGVISSRAFCGLDIFLEVQHADDFEGVALSAALVAKGMQTEQGVNGKVVGFFVFHAIVSRDDQAACLVRYSTSLPAMAVCVEGCSSDIASTVRASIRPGLMR